MTILIMIFMCMDSDYFDISYSVKLSMEKVFITMGPEGVFDDTPQPLYNTVLDITQTNAGPQTVIRD